MAQQSDAFSWIMLIFGGIIGLGGYPIFLLQRKNVGFLFGLPVGLWIIATYKDRIPSNLAIPVVIVSGFVGAALFYGSVTMMNVAVSFFLGFALSHEIYAIVLHQIPSPVIPAIVGVICAAIASVYGILFVMGVLATAGALMMTAGLEAMFLPRQMFDSPITIVGFNLTPVQNVIFIVIFLALIVAGVFAQFFGLRELLKRV